MAHGFVTPGPKNLLDYQQSISSNINSKSTSWLQLCVRIFTMCFCANIAVPRVCQELVSECLMLTVIRTMNTIEIARRRVLHVMIKNVHATNANYAYN